MMAQDYPITHTTLVCLSLSFSSLSPSFSPSPLFSSPVLFSLSLPLLSSSLSSSHFHQPALPVTTKHSRWRCHGCPTSPSFSSCLLHTSRGRCHGCRRLLTAASWWRGMGERRG